MIGIKNLSKLFFFLSVFIFAFSVFGFNTVLGKNNDDSIESIESIANKTLIVVYNEKVKVKDIKKMEGVNFKGNKKLEYINQEILTFETVEEALKAKKKLEKDKDVISVEFDKAYYTSSSLTTFNDTHFSSLFHLNKNTFIPQDNMAVSKLANHLYPSTNPVVKIAIIDDSFYTGHPDLRGQLLDGYDAYNRKLESQGGTLLQGTASHGTLVAGVAVAKSNNGMHGASVGGTFDNVKAIPISASIKGILLTSLIIDGIDHAISRGADVINMSFGSKTYDSTLENALNVAYNKGIALFAARGNYYDDAPLYPANLSIVESVSNINKNMTLSYDSSYGDTDWVGSGTSVIQLHNNGTSEILANGGTSSASPHVASIYAAMKAVYPNASRETLLSIMNTTAYKISDTYKHGKGYPNAVEAIRMARIKSSEFTSMPNQYSVPTNKVWTITFNDELALGNFYGVYVIDSKGKEHSVNVTINPSNNKQLIVTPVGNYKSLTNYTLVASDLYSKSGLKLKTNVTLNFTTN